MDHFQTVSSQTNYRHITQVTFNQSKNKLKIKKLLDIKNGHRNPTIQIADIILKDASISTTKKYLLRKYGSLSQTINKSHKKFSQKHEWLYIPGSLYHPNIRNCQAE